MAPSYGIIYWQMSVVVTTVTGIQPVVNCTLLDFDDHKWPSYRSKYEMVLYK